MSALQKVLIFQIGSLGDTVISMPCYREIARRHPDAERYLLTNFPIGQKMVQAEAILRPCGLIQGSIEYPMPLRGLRNIAALYRRLRAFKIDILYYLTPERRLSNLVRHYAFFKMCGVDEVRGVPWLRQQRFSLPTGRGEMWESEASRLLRSIRGSDVPFPPDPADRSLDLSPSERLAVDRLLSRVPGLTRFVAISVGGKVPINDWGDTRWAALLSRLSAGEPDLGAVFVGSADERGRNEVLAEAWKGPKLNSCGQMTPRETAALIERASLFIGHDTGTLHLAAAVGTRVVGIFSARNFPGRWFSDRPGDQFFYNRTACFGCELERPTDCPHKVACMDGHRLEEIEVAVREALARDPGNPVLSSAPFCVEGV